MSASKFRRVASPISSLENQAIHDLPSALSWLERNRPDLARLLGTAPIEGVTAANGADASNTTLRQVVRNPGNYRIFNAATWRSSLQRLGQGIVRLAAGSKIIEMIGELIAGSHIAVEIAPWALATQAATQMPTPGASGSTTNPQGAINALNTDPSMAPKGNSGQALGGYIGQSTPPLITIPNVYARDPLTDTNFLSLSHMVQSPVSYKCDSSTGDILTNNAAAASQASTEAPLPNDVKTPNYYAQDPLMTSNFDNIAQLVQSPNNYKFDNTGYIQSNASTRGAAHRNGGTVPLLGTSLILPHYVVRP